MSEPVTVSITRHLDPGHEPEMLSWLQAGMSLMQQSDGFLGAGWVRPEAGSSEWHMLYRFDDPGSLLGWEQSHERQWWRSSAAGLGLVESRVERRTGIEGWFDPPTTRDVQDLRAAPTPPPRWKQACVIFLIFFPLSLVVNWLNSHLIPGWPLPLRVLATVLVMTPIMTYVALPWITKRMEWWLQGRPAPWRR
jgi:antibiotic biosynthesis monooxygenase (ABM) superfamily enzyme